MKNSIATRKCAAWIGCGNLEVPVSQISFRGFCPDCEREANGQPEYEAQTMYTFAPADIAEVHLENMLRAMIDNSASAIIVHVDGVEYEVRLKAAKRVNRAYAPKPQHGCPCARCRHS